MERVATNNTFTHLKGDFIMKRFISLVVLAGLSVMVLATATYAQDTSTPEGTVRLFKAAIDNSNLTAMANLMTEKDGSQPVQQANLETTENSLEGLQSSWDGVDFAYGETATLDGKTRVNVTVSSLSQQVRFFVKQFDGAWYISDIEIYQN
jgi:uncharacterized membrane protein YvbJ